jgi:uncharacterized membrane protein YjgN (DUF898 family)
VPIWRETSLRLVRGIILSFILYIPALLVGGIAINTIIANADGAMINSLGINTMVAFVSAVGGVFIISLLIPILVFGVAIYSPSKKND